MASRKHEGQSELLPPPAEERQTEKASEPKHYGQHDGQCHFEYEGKRCPLPGNQTMSMGRHGTYYCLWHAHGDNRRNDFMQQQHFERYCDPENGRACVADYIDAFLRIRPQDDLERYVRAHPELARQPHEGRSEYVERMRAIIEPLKAATRARGARDA